MRTEESVLGHVINHNDMLAWLKERESLFSPVMNGYLKAPYREYTTTLPLIDTDGKITDLGCGNAMLLKFLMNFSDQELVPYGIDRNKEPIQQAKKEVLPEYADNFAVCDVNEYDFAEGPFDIIITNPFYAKRAKQFTEKCLNNLNSHGKLIYRVHYDTLRYYDIISLSEVPELKEFDMRTSCGHGVVFGTLYRDNNL